MNKNLQDLPLEVRLMILNYLDLNSLLKCRLINKSLNRIVDTIKVKNLSVTDNKPVRRFHNESTVGGLVKYFYINEPVDKACSFVTSNMDFFQSELMKVTLGRLKQLCVDESLSFYSVDTNLNQLRHLEQLQVKGMSTARGATLRLPSLKILNIDSIKTDLFKLDTPSLFAFKSNRITNVEFLYPHTITHLGK